MMIADKSVRGRGQEKDCRFRRAAPLFYSDESIAVPLLTEKLFLLTKKPVT
jgi:hypothetical protein